jgi:hypothetical protein
MDHIIDHKLFTDLPEDTDAIWRNIFVKYFYDEDLTDSEIESIDHIRFDNNIAMFYILPLLIFCLERYIERALR